MEMKNALRNKLEIFIRKYYQNRLIKGLIYGVGLSLAYFFVLALAEYFGHFGSTTRLVLLVLMLAGLASIVGYYILYPLAKLMNIGRRISYDKAARIIGKHFPEVDDKILNTLQLQSLSVAQSDLLKASIDQRIAGLTPVPFGNAIDFGENKKYWPVLVIPVLVFVGVFISGRWDMVSESGKRIAAYDREFLPKAPFEFILKNSYLQVEQGEDIRLELVFEGSSLPADAMVILPSGESRMLKNEQGGFQYSLNNLQQDVSFRFGAAGFLSEMYEIEVLPVPQINAFTLQVVPPSYTGIKPFETEAKLVQDIPEGSEVSWLLNLRQADEAYLLKDTTSYVFEKGNQNSFKLSQKVRSSFDYAVRTQNQSLSKTNISGNRIKVIRDEYPQIQAEFNVDSSNSNVVYYSGSVRDDYGFSQLNLVIKRGKRVFKNPLKVNKGAVSQTFGSALQLDSLSGDRSIDLRLYVEVLDNDGVNGAKAARSHEFSFKVLGAGEKKEKISKEYQKVFSESEAIQNEMEKLQKALEAMRKQMMEKSTLSYQDKSKLKEMLIKQKELLQRQKENEKQLKKLQKDEEKLGDKKEEVKEKEEQIDKIKSDKEKEAEELMKEIQRLMEELDTEKLMKKLEQLNKMNEQTQKAMERKDANLKDLQFQKDLLEQASKLEKLSKEMDELSKQEDSPQDKEGSEKSKEGEEQKGDKESKSGDEKSERQKQDDIEKEFEKVKEKLEEMKKENEKFEKASEEQKVDEESEEASEQMKQSQQNLQQNQQQKANQNQKKASEKMQEMSESLQQAMSQMQSQANQVNMETLRQILENLEVLSFDVEELSDETRDIKKEDPDFKRLLTEQRRLKDGAKVIEDSLTALAKKVPEIQQEVFTELDLVKTNLDRSINDLEELRNAQAAAHQQYVMTSANNLALMLEQSLRQMQQMMAQSKPGDQQCEKPGQKPGSRPSMSQVRQMQQGLGQKMDRMQKGKKPQKDGKGERGMNGKEMVEIMSKQEQLRRTLEELSEKEGNSGNKGNLQRAIDEMKEMERDLVDGRLGSDYKKRLREIESRLLESEKAERQQKQEERRESESADEVDQLYKQELEKYLKEKERENESLNRLPLDFRNYYKSQTSRYLN